MRTMRNRFLLVLLCTILLCVCTASQPILLANHQPSQDHFAPKGQIQTIQNANSLPVAQGNWPLFRGDLMHQANAVSGGSKLTMAWAYCTQQPIFSSPVVQNGVVRLLTIESVAHREPYLSSDMRT